MNRPATNLGLTVANLSMLKVPSLASPHDVGQVQLVGLLITSPKELLVDVGEPILACKFAGRVCKGSAKNHKIANEQAAHLAW